MTQKIDVDLDRWNQTEERWRYCLELEKGNLLFFPKIPFDFQQEEIAVLLGQQPQNKGLNENSFYKPVEDHALNDRTKDRKNAEKLQDVLKGYSQKAQGFLSQLLEPYAKKWEMDYAKFFPFQEKKSKLRAQSDLLHLETFPEKPLNGDRILQFFTNIHPQESRCWATSENFAVLIRRFVGQGLSLPKFTAPGHISQAVGNVKRALHDVFCKTPIRSAYDTFMLRLHRFMKEHREFQKTCPKDLWEFPPNSCWAMFTDQVSHAVMSGHYALEQTFVIPYQALLFPEASPLCELERLAKRSLVV